MEFVFLVWHLFHLGLVLAEGLKINKTFNYVNLTREFKKKKNFISFQTSLIS